MFLLLSIISAFRAIDGVAISNVLTTIVVMMLNTFNLSHHCYSYISGDNGRDGSCPSFD